MTKIPCSTLLFFGGGGVDEIMGGREHLGKLSYILKKWVNIAHFTQRHSLSRGMRDSNNGEI